MLRSSPGGGGRGWAQLELTDKAHLFWQISSNDVKLDWYANAIFAASKAIVASSENQIPIQHVIQKLLIWLDIPDYPTGLENCVRQESGYVVMTTGEYLCGKNKAL